MRCEMCDSLGLRSVLSLGSSPPACAMLEAPGPEIHYPLELLRCDFCDLVQLSATVDPAQVFPDYYPYSSGNSAALRENFKDLAASVEVAPDDLVVDIGANDGTLLSNFNCRTIGVEPTAQAQKIKGLVYKNFFSLDLAKKIRAEWGPAKVITACNVLAHVENIHNVMAGIVHLLADDGVLVAENHDLASVVAGQWDTVYHEHLRYFDRHTFGNLLQAHGMAERQYRDIPTHGGSFRTHAVKGQRKWFDTHRHYDFDRLARSASHARDRIRHRTLDPVWGIGATARATTIINYCGLDVEDVEYVCEVATSDKIGGYIPGTRIPVVDELELFNEHPSPAAMLFSWHLADSIVPKLREDGYEGEIIVPLPKLRVL